MASLCHNELTHWKRNGIALSCRRQFTRIFFNQNKWLFSLFSFHLRLFRSVQLTIIPNWFKWRHRTDYKPLLEQCWYATLAHICITRSKWVKHAIVVPLFSDNWTNINANIEEWRKSIHIYGFLTIQRLRFKHNLIGGKSWHVCYH